LKNGELHRRTIYNDLVDFSSYPPAPYSGSAAGYFCMNVTDAESYLHYSQTLEFLDTQSP
jgi:hypothetical protein